VQDTGQPGRSMTETGNPAQGSEAGNQPSRRRRGKAAQRLQSRRPSEAVTLTVDIIAQRAGDVGAPRWTSSISSACDPGRAEEQRG